MTGSLLHRIKEKNDELSREKMASQENLKGILKSKNSGNTLIDSPAVVAQMHQTMGSFGSFVKHDLDNLKHYNTQVNKKSESPSSKSNVSFLERKDEPKGRS